MKMTIESTSRIVTLDGVQNRIWEGTSEKGVRVVAFVHRVALMEGDPEEFQRDLMQVNPPSTEAEAFPSRLFTTPNGVGG